MVPKIGALERGVKYYLLSKVERFALQYILRSISMYYGCISVDIRIIVYYACIVVYSCITSCSKGGAEVELALCLRGLEQI